MNKLFLFLLAFFAVSLFFACDKQKTAQEMLKEEKNAINRFINDNGIIVTNDTDKMYEDNVFFKTKEGLYIHVIDSGNGNKAKYNQEVLVRFKDLIYFKDDTTKRSNLPAGNIPSVFYFGNSYSYGDDYACDGWAIGLSYVSENAEVSLIIPSALLPSYNQSYFIPAYYGYIKYRFK